MRQENLESNVYALKTTTFLCSSSVSIIISDLLIMPLIACGLVISLYEDVLVSCLPITVNSPDT